MHKIIFFSRKPEKNSRFHQLIKVELGYPIYLASAKALASLCICVDSPEPLLIADAISIGIFCTDLKMI